MSMPSTLHDEIHDWFFSEYFKDFIAISAGKMDPEMILAYWGAPIHMSGPTHSRWLTSSEEVVRFLENMQAALKTAGYNHTVAIDENIMVYSENASRVETIMSRRRGDATEMDRAAISFEIRRAGDGWTIISTTARPTDLAKLHDVW